MKKKNNEKDLWEKDYSWGQGKFLGIEFVRPDTPEAREVENFICPECKDKLSPQNLATTDKTMIITQLTCPDEHSFITATEKKEKEIRETVMNHITSQK